MKIEEAKQNYYEHSGKASDVARQLAFAGIAVVWVFKLDQGRGRFSVPGQLMLPLGWLVAVLAADMLQYAWAAGAWGIYHRWRETTTGGDDDRLAPRWINWPSVTFFSLKILMTFIAYALLFSAVSSSI